MTAIGNGDMLIRPHDHRLGTPSLSGLTSERNIRPEAQIFDSLLEVREWDVYDFTNGHAMQFSIQYFLVRVCQFPSGKKRTSTVPPGC